MKFSKTLGLSAVALLSSTAFVSAQDNLDLSLGGTLGFNFINLPSITTSVNATGTGTIDNTIDPQGVGGTFGLSGSVALGDVNDWQTSIGFTGFATIGGIRGSATTTFSGPGVVIIPGYTTPATSNITLTTNAAVPSVSSSVTDAAPGGGASATIIPLVVTPGTSNLAGVSVSAAGDSFSYGGAQGNGAGVVASYGAIGATDGGIFIAAGDLTGLTITQTYNEAFLYTGADVTLAMTGMPSENLYLQAYAGPSYRYMSRSGTTKVSVDIPELQPSAITFPVYSTSRVEDTRSHYFGGVVGMSGTTSITPTLTLTLGVEGGVYGVNDTLTGTESYTVEGGFNTLGPVPTTTVVNSTVATGSSTGTAFSLRGNAAVTAALDTNKQITFAGSAEYLSHVATTTHTNDAVVTNNYPAGSTTGSIVYNGTASSNLPALSFGGMLNLGGSVSLTGQF